MSDHEHGDDSFSHELAVKSGTRKSHPDADNFKFYTPPVYVGGWNIGNFTIMMQSKPTDIQIKNTEELFGWKWEDIK